MQNKNSMKVIIKHTLLKEPNELYFPILTGCKQSKNIRQIELLEGILKLLVKEMNADVSFDNENLFWQEFIRKYIFVIYNPIETFKMDVTSAK